MHGSQGVDDPLRALRILDGIAEVIKHLVLDIEVRLELRMRQDRLDGVNELCIGPQRELVLFGALAFAEDGLLAQGGVRHELIVKIEGDGKPGGDRPFRKSQRAQDSQVGRLDPERLPVRKADLTEGRDGLDREIPLRRLGIWRPGGLVVRLDFGGTGRVQVPAVLGYFIADIAADEVRDCRHIEGVTDVGVGNAVLDRAQVDVRQRGLGHGRDDASHSGQIVWQRFIDHDIVDMGTVIRIHRLQPAIPHPLVQREERDVGIDIFVQHNGDTGSPQHRQGGLEIENLVIGYP